MLLVASKLLPRPARGRYSQFAKTFAGLQGFVRFGIPLDYMAELRDPVILLAEFDQRKAFLQLSGSSLVSGRKVLHNLVVALRGLFIISLAELNLAQIEVAIPGKIGVGIKLQVLGKFLRSQIVVAAVVIAQRVVIKHIGRGSLR